MRRNRRREASSVTRQRESKESGTLSPQGELVQLAVSEIRPSVHNPRQLFDPENLATLKKSIREHGVLVPITVYRMPAQDRYAIVDGERRYRCCVDLVRDGVGMTVPANIVSAPNQMSELIYMFNIHQYRRQWELMPTAIALQSVMSGLGIRDDKELNELTGLSAPQIERCKLILSFPEKYRRMSLDADPTKRIPSNFWVELHPVLELSNKLTPGLVAEYGRDRITDLLIDKYRKKRIKSVIHFRRILEAHETREADENGRSEVAERLREYVLTPELETREAFDEFIVGSRRVQRATDAADRFISDLRKAKIDNASDQKDDLIAKLAEVVHVVQGLLSRLEGDDPPPESDS